jgi:hypothetical protein
MTEFELKHGLSQDEPGPLEPVEIAQQPGAAPATGNTARDQEMYVAGIRTGEANTKHNAAIRASIPDGWELVTRKTCYALMHDGAVIATLAGPESETNAAIIARMLAAPGVSTVEDAQPWPSGLLDRVKAAEKRIRDGHGLMRVPADPTDPDLVLAEIAALIEGRKPPFWLRPAPAAGDALTESAPEWAMCESRGPWARNSLMAAIHLLREKETRARHAFTKDYMGLPARYIADAYGEAAAVVERKLGAIAAQRKGGS